MLRRHILACLAVLLCATTVPAEDYDMPFILGSGESVAVGPDGLVGGFDQIATDSRCPADAYCFWPGDAETVLFAERPAFAVEFFTLHTYYDWDHTTVLGAWRVTLLQVSPYPQSSGVPIPPETYRVTLEVSLLEPVGFEPTSWGAAKARYR